MRQMKKKRKQIRHLWITIDVFFDFLGTFLGVIVERRDGFSDIILNLESESFEGDFEGVSGLGGPFIELGTSIYQASTDDEL